MIRANLLEKKKISFVLLLFNLTFLLFCLGVKGFFWAVFFSFELSFVGSLAIIIASFLSYRKNILKQAQKLPQKALLIFYKKQILSKNIKFYTLNDDLKLGKKMLLFGSFFALVKLFLYGLFAVSFLILVKKGMLDIMAIFMGVSSLLLGFFTLLFVLRKNK